MSWTAVLFDLDGTILDSAPIICAAMSVASTEFGHPRPPETFAPYVGPPLWHTFSEVTGESPEQVDRIVTRYREIYQSMMAGTPAFPGVPEVVQELAARRIPMGVATSKLRSMAISLIEGIGLADHFITVQGAGIDAASADKATVIEQALTDLATAGVDLSNAVMVGDRHHDIEGAARHGIPTILVSWGYALAGEKEGAISVVDTPQALLAALTTDRR